MKSRKCILKGKKNYILLEGSVLVITEPQELDDTELRGWGFDLILIEQTLESEVMFAEKSFRRKFMPNLNEGGKVLFFKQHNC